MPIGVRRRFPVKRPDGQGSILQGRHNPQTFDIGVQVFSGGNSALKDCPDEMKGCMFAQREFLHPAYVKIDAPAGTTVYLLLGTAGPAQRARQSAEACGFAKLGTVHYESGSVFAYKEKFQTEKLFTINGSGIANAVVSAHLELANLPTPSNDNNNPSNDNGTSGDDESPSNPAEVQISGTGPNFTISRLQSSIEGLYVIIEDSGQHLGLASQLILTVTPGDSKKDYVPISFTTPAGHEMYMVLDDVVRALDLHYHLSGVKKLELSFEDKYTPKDGGSIGAAIGTLMLSVIRNFQIDPAFAITGDVTADSKIRKIGGVAAKLRGAAASGCKIVAVPTENFDQVRDAMVYDGPSVITNVQVLGVATLDDAAAAARVDRDSSLAHAIDLFAKVQESIKQSPAYIFSSEAQDCLHQVLDQFPNHYSAALLLEYSRHEVPRLSAMATEYYISIAVKEFNSGPTVDSKVSDYSAQTRWKDSTNFVPSAIWTSGLISIRGSTTSKFMSAPATERQSASRRRTIPTKECSTKPTSSTPIATCRKKCFRKEFEC